MPRNGVIDAASTSPAVNPAKVRTSPSRNSSRMTLNCGAPRAGARGPEQSLEAWLAEVHAGRTTADLMGDSPDDDIADPIGQPRPA